MTTEAVCRICKVASAKRRSFFKGKAKMENSKIEWTDHTFNPWIGCQHVSPGCDHCYAETQNAFRKWNGGTWGPHAPRKRTSKASWKRPIKWDAEARAFKREQGRRPRVFCASLADVFDNRVPKHWREDLFALIRKCKHLDWLLLTKRPENILKMLPPDWGAGYPNVWIGVTRKIKGILIVVGRSCRKYPLRLNSSRTSRRLGHCGYRRRAQCQIGSSREGKAVAVLGR
jgi:protein gp37